MIPNRRGIAALFDAMIFLAIAALVSAALLSAFSAETGRNKSGDQEMVESAHQVLLRSTLPDRAGNNQSVRAFFLQTAGGESDHDRSIRRSLDLLLPGWGWRWSVERSDRSYVYGSMPSSSAPTDLYCSLVRAPFQGEEVVFKLEAWRA